eukprot:Gregarina_sp_Poly_1__1313@NODE_1323_length_4381_cov_311_023644_g810_i1_p1_GENE_NODE_1323_length_4381_cov_311_023644_g810_i1NODE_1323_length_4381_cov_311_023644_g810_i1_p1_ORF_typecomplete_len685_score100_40UCH/PF00443_29/3_7e40UCH_1/PF13423_6/2_9e14UCH_1/PF13423_6/3_2e03_NODE_1323_length_4381_cov_311_023644_g810_i118013855
MSTALVQTAATQTWPIAEKTFCAETFAFAPAKRLLDSEENGGSKSSQPNIVSHQSKGGVWFKRDNKLLWYPFALEWFCAPGSVDRRLTFPANQKQGAGLGLRNRRNACFLNATLQALTYLPPFWISAQKSRHARHCVRKQRNLYCGYCEFETHIRTVSVQRGVVSKAFRTDAVDIKFYPRLHSEMLHKFNVSTRKQACAYEALTMVLDWLRRYDLPPEQETRFLRHKIPFPQLNTAYLGQCIGSVLQHRRTCLHCHEETIVHEVVNDFVMSLNDSKSLEDALQRHFAPEELDEANKSDCDVCKSKQIKRLEKRIVVPPNILILVVKRSQWFSQSPLAGFPGLMKDDRSLKVPRILDVGPLLNFSGSSAAGAGSYSQTEHKYQIASAVVHHGIPMAGHYVAIAQSPSERYFKYNDECVTPIQEERLLKELSKAYIYFYRRLTGGTPLPSKEDVVTVTDAAASKINLNKSSESKPLSLIVSVTASVTPPTVAAPTLLHPASDDNYSEATRSPSDINEEASTATSSNAGLDGFSGGDSVSGLNVTPRSVASQGSSIISSRKARGLRENVTRFFSQALSFEKAPPATETQRTDVQKQPQPIDLSAAAVAPQWDAETLQETGAQLGRFKQHKSRRVPVEKTIPGNKRQQHDLEYDKGRSKKKKKIDGGSRKDTPNCRAFDQIQREIANN